MISSDPPKRILLLRPDTYGDLVLFEPVLRLLRHAWPGTEVGVLIRERYADAVPLLASEGVRFLTTRCDPYREAPGADPAALTALGETVKGFAPDCVVAACTEQTWLEAAVAAFLPGTRQVSMGPGLTDPLARAALEAVLPVDWAAVYPERLAVEPEGNKWEKNLRLAGALLGSEAPRWWPVTRVPADAQDRAARILAEAGLRGGEYVACAAAGTANVQIKSWSAESYGATPAWLERERGVRALLVGHVSELAHLEKVREAARRDGASPALWTGQDGEMPILAGLLESASFYFGNDTGALHLAAALGKLVAAVFGGGHWPRFQPVARRALSIVQPLPCFGCAWDCYYADALCVRTTSPESVRQALEQFLRDGAEASVVFRAEGLQDGTRALINAATPGLRARREDSADRLRQVETLTGWLRASEADREARLRQVEQLASQLRTSEEDRAARLIQTQELTTLLAANEGDRDARGKQVAELTALFKASESDRVARYGQIQELTAWLQASRAECAALEHRGEAFARANDELRQRLHGSEAQRTTARTEVRRSARELALTRRLLRFAVSDASAPRQPEAASLAPGATTAPVGSITTGYPAIPLPDVLAHPRRGARHAGPRGGRGDLRARRRRPAARRQRARAA